MDLVEDGSTSSKQVLNIGCLFVSLNQDAESCNGTDISEDVQVRAEDWTLDIDSNDFDQELESIRPTLKEEYQSFSDFPGETYAKGHLEEIVRYSYATAMP